MLLFFVLVFGVSTKIVTSKAIQPENDEIIGDFSKIASHIYGQPNQSVGEKISKWSKEQASAESLGSYFQGDILIPREHGRNGIMDFSMKWANGTIPYVISKDFSSWDSYLIRRAFYEIEIKTCIRFVPRSKTQHPDYLYIQDSFTGCWSSVGRIGGRQELNIQTPGCNNQGTIVHELLHAIGFWHEQSREDRDDFIEVKWENIMDGVEVNFGKAESGATSALGVPYDYSSILHYSPYSFSKNGRPTLVATKSGADKMGQRLRLSKRDISKVNRLYNCKKFLINDKQKNLNKDDSSNEVR